MMTEEKSSGRRLRVKERRRYTEEYADEEELLFDRGRSFDVDEKLVSDRFDLNDIVIEMTGSQLTLSYIQENGFDQPIVVKNMQGLGMKMPPKNFSVSDVKQCVGSRRVLDVMDVETQRDFNMTMKEWCNYYNSPERDRLLNVISLEFSHTKLESLIESPSIVKQVDWVDWVWPKHLKQMQTEGTNAIEDMKYPKVQKYCLMSVKGCYTDFHIDFGGTSVWYHILKGKKVFWLIPPSERNIQLYEQWVLSGKQSDIFFGDTVDQCGRVYLEDGNTFFIPTGWIHAVYTPEDSLVFGGNFLHSFGIEKQLRVAQVEDMTKVPAKFRYPFYTEVLWYVLARYVFCLMGKNHLSCNEDGTSIKESNDDKNSVLNGKIQNGTSKQHAHLTPFELSGLKAIIMWLSRLSPSKRSLPDLIVNAEHLLNDAKVLIDEHSRDNHKLAITGKPCLFWSTSTSTSKKFNLSSSSSSSSSSSGTLSITSQLRQIKHHSHSNSNNNTIKMKNSINNSPNNNNNNIESSTSNTSSSHSVLERSESPPTRPISSNQYRINVGATITQPELIPSSFAGLIAATGMGNINASFNPPKPPAPIVASIPQMIISVPAAGYLPNPPNANSLPPPPPLISVNNYINQSNSSPIKGSQINQIMSNHDVNSSRVLSNNSTQTNFVQDLSSVVDQQSATINQTATTITSTSTINNNQQTLPMNYQSPLQKFANQSQASQSNQSSTMHGQTQTQKMHFPVAVPPSGFHQEKGTSTGTSTKSLGKGSANDNSRRRRTRCKKCDACIRADCGECHFCKDMKKFGGPGRMKQSCIARQCMAPVLPHTACCMICGRDGWEKLNIDSSINDDTASSLMECSQCWEIVHPFCLGEKYSDMAHINGNINNDLPNSWECPRCIKMGKPNTFSGCLKTKISKSSAHSNSYSVSSSTSTTTLPNAIKLEEQTTTSTSTTNSPKKFKPNDESPPSTEDELEDKDDDTENDSKNDSKLLLNHNSSSAHVRSCSRFPLLTQGIKSNSPLIGGHKSDSVSQNSNKTEVKTFSSSPVISTKRKNESSRERIFKSLKGLKKSHELKGSSSQLQIIKKAAAKLFNHKESSSGSNSSSVGSPSFEQVKQEFDEAKHDVDDESTEDEDQEQINLIAAKFNQQNNDHNNVYQNALPAKELIKPKYVVRPAPLEEDISTEEEERSSETENENDSSQENDDDDDEDEIVKMKKEKQKSKKRYLKKFRKKKPSNLALEKDIIIPILPYLNRKDILSCMLVCKLWNRWSCDPALWKTIDLTRKKITSTVLIGIVRRQPQVLNLSWTNISKRQLAWLIARLPHLQSLSMAGCSSPAATALASCNCPFLKSLDLSWCDGIDDELIRELFSAPTDSRPGVLETKTRLRLLQQISLAGSDISDVSIRLMNHHLPNLTHIDLSHCHKITDLGIAVLGAAKSTKLIKLNLSSCSLISDTSLDALRRCTSLMSLDMRDCSQVTIPGCNKFIQTCVNSNNGKRLSINDGKLMETV